MYWIYYVNNYMFGSNIDNKKKNNEEDWNEGWKGIETWFMTSGLASRGSHLLEDLEEGVAIIRWFFAFNFLLNFVCV